jgi:hypothetical protein
MEKFWVMSMFLDKNLIFSLPMQRMGMFPSDNVMEVVFPLGNNLMPPLACESREPSVIF